LIETEKLVSEKTCPESLTNNDQVNLTLAEHPHTDKSCMTPKNWLKPSEALTRFVPDKPSEDRNARSMKLLRFGVCIGDIGLLVPAGMHSELVEHTRIYPLPTAPHWFLGLINLRGTLVPVFDLKALFQMDNPATQKTSLLVLNKDEQAVGFLIDDLPVALSNTRRLTHFPILPTVLRGHAQIVYVQDDRIWVEFEFDGFFHEVSALNVA
jgi:twitching motility protein PilI